MEKLRKFLKHAERFCVLSYLGGIVWFVLLNHDEFSARCYFSENALLPGLVELGDSTTESVISQLNQQCQSNPKEAIKKLLEDAGLEVYEQKFQFQDSFIGDEKVVNGSNVYGIVRVPRAASTECIVIDVPMYEDHFNYGTGVAIALSQQMRNQLFWAKDIVFVFSQHGTIGTRAWLDDYHGMTSSHIRANQLEARAGSIQAAIVLEIKEKKLSYANLKLEGYNGQLPNMDLSNLAIHLLRMEGIQPSLNHQLRQRPAITYDGVKQHFLSTALMMKQLMTGKASGNHGEFMLYNIEALTIEGIYKSQWSNRGLLPLERVLNGISRSLNNLLERFHQSFFFYLLPSTDRYISIGMYMPCLGLVLLPAALKALSLAVEMQPKISDSAEIPKEDEDTEPSNTEPENDKKEKIAKEEEIDEFLSEIGSKYATNPTSEGEEETRSAWYEVITLIVCCHVTGCFLFHSPYLTPVWAKMLEVPPTYSFVLIQLFIYVVGMFLASYTAVSMANADCLRMVNLLQLSITLGAVSIINFSLGFSIAVVTIPVLVLIRANETRFKYLFKLLVLVISPFVIFTAIFNIGNFVELYKQQLTHQSWLFFATTQIFYPLWLQFWSLTCSSSFRDVDLKVSNDTK